MSANVPPSRKSSTRRAARLFQQFTGHKAKPVAVMNFPDLDGTTVAAFGTCDAVCYTTVRDGKTERYIHEFAEKDAPLLAVTADGRQLLLLGGQYRFTELGIVDKSWKGD